jgi:hypothetical protein
MRRTIAIALLASLLASLALAFSCGCGTIPATAPVPGPGNPLVPAQTASKTVGEANEKALELQQQVDENTTP